MKNSNPQVLKKKDVLIGLLLSKEHETLPESEAKILIEKLLDGKPIEKKQNLLIFQIPINTKKSIEHVKKTLKRLAYTKQVFHIISKTKNITELNTKILNGQINPKSPFLEKKAKLSFKINSLNLEQEPTKFLDIPELAKAISTHKDIGPAKMKNPDTNFYAIYSKTIYFGIKIWHNDEKFSERRGDKRPAPHPTTMSPKLARAIINLSGAKKEILDPFCGAGGILIEAGLMGLKSTGIDIDLEMTIRAKLNLEHFKLKNYAILKQNALEYTIKTEAVITDVPYGKSSKLNQNLNTLIKEFLRKYKKLTKKIILVHPDKIHLNKLIIKTKWKISEEHKIYIHKSLTRTITILYTP